MTTWAEHWEDIDRSNHKHAVWNMLYEKETAELRALLVEKHGEAYVAKVEQSIINNEKEQERR